MNKNDNFRKISMRVGNFRLVHARDRKGMAYVGVSAISGQWNIRWGEGCMMYGLMLLFMTGKGEKELDAMLYLMFAATSYAHSTEFYLGLNSLIIDELKKVKAGLIDEQKDKEALEEVSRMEELSREIEEAEKDGKA